MRNISASKYRCLVTIERPTKFDHLHLSLPSGNHPVHIQPHHIKNLFRDLALASCKIKTMECTRNLNPDEKVHHFNIKAPTLNMSIACNTEGVFMAVTSPVHLTLDCQGHP